MSKFNSNASGSSSQPKISTLDSVVSNLVRAAVGGNTSAIPDEDLDSYVANMIMQEAKQKSKKYQEIGVRAYLPGNTGPGMRPDRSFLRNVIKQTDSHNQALLKRERQSGSGYESSQGVRPEPGTWKRKRRGSRNSNSDSEDSGNEYKSSKRKRKESTSRCESDDSDTKSRRNRKKGRLKPAKTDDKESSRKLDEDKGRFSASETRDINPAVGLPSTQPNPDRVIRGRGVPRGSSNLDKVFSSSYNPRRDFDTDIVDVLSNDALDDRIAQALAKGQKSKKEKKKKDKRKVEDKEKRKKKKRKSRKRGHSSTEDDSD
ncbi:hypothetical protein BKA69DRAFT_1036014 [Paraphysoderma sedebokerense]|nr:hypothetical protein BKA69DRAFT_1036014 [Paraphysoderma sedebokerense]